MISSKCDFICAANTPSKERPTEVSASARRSRNDQNDRSGTLARRRLAFPRAPVTGRAFLSARPLIRPETRSSPRTNQWPLSTKLWPNSQALGGFSPGRRVLRSYRRGGARCKSMRWTGTRAISTEEFAPELSSIQPCRLLRRRACLPRSRFPPDFAGTLGEQPKGLNLDRITSAVFYNG